MACRSPIHPYMDDDYVPDVDEMDHFYYLKSLDYLTPAQLLNEGRFARVMRALLQHKDTAYLVPYYNLLKEAENLIRVNYITKFTSFLSNNQDNEILHEILPLLFHDICRYGSVGCATALLESPLRERVDLHQRFVTSYAPLEYAALHLSLGFTQILLNHGADPNKEECYFHGYPLQTAISELCSNDYVKQWTETKSIFKLFYVLCLPELNEPLDAIRLLASHTRPLEKLLDYHISHGCISMLIVLVMAARDDLLVPSTNGGSIETTRIGKYLTRELSSNRLLIKGLSKSALIKVLMDAQMKVETLWRAIDVLERFRNSPRLKSVPKNDVPFHIAIDLVDDAGFELNPEDVLCDDMDCMRPNLSSSTSIDLSKRIDLDKHSVFGSGLRVIKPANGCSLFSSLSKSNSQHQEYHTFPAMNSNMLKPMETQLSKAVPVKPALHNVIASARKCAPLMWIAKRSIK